MVPVHLIHKLMMTNMILHNYVLPVILGLFSAFLYGLFFSRYEKRIRLYLQSRKKGRQRTMYVKTFVYAVRGDAKVYNTKLLGYLLLFFPLFFAAFHYPLHEQVSIQVHTVEEQMNSISLLKEIEAGSTTQAQPKPEISLDELEANALSLQKSTNLLLLISRLWYLFPLIWILYMLLIWLPSIVFRARFEVELERFMSRIQGLASKAELADLIKLELQVIDEKSAEHFVRQLSNIAERHDVGELVSTFRLWTDDK